MRYAPKFLQPWERIDRMIEERCAEAHTEIKRMANKARSEIGPKREIKSVAMDNRLIYLQQMLAHYTPSPEEMRRVCDAQRAASEYPGYPYLNAGAAPAGLGIFGGIGSILGGL